MFCSFCGKENNNNFYCSNCGKTVQEKYLETNNFKIIEEKMVFCEKCGIKSHDRYCTNCGGSTCTLTIEQGNDFNSNAQTFKAVKSVVESKFKNRTFEDIKNISNVKDLLKDKLLIQNSTISALKILVTGFIISFMLFMVITNIDTTEDFFEHIDTLQAEVHEYGDANTHIKIKPNAFDVYGFAFQNPVIFKAQGKTDEESFGQLKVKLNLPMLILLLIPLIAVGMMQQKFYKDENTTKYHLKEYFITAVIFSTIFNVIQIFNSKSVAIALYGKGFKATGGFEFFTGLIMVFAIILTLQILLSMRSKRESIQDVVGSNLITDNMEAVKTYMINMSRNTLVFIAFTLLFIVFSDIDIDEKFYVILSYLAIIPNIFSNIWLFLCGNTFVMNGLNNISVWDSWSGLNTASKYSDISISSYLPYYAIVGLLILAFVFIMIEAVNRLDKDQYFVRLSIFAGTIGIINVIIATLSKIAMKVDGNQELLEIIRSLFNIDLMNTSSFYIGYPIVGLLVVTFVAIFIIGSGMHLLKDNEIYLKCINVMDTKKKTIKIGYVIALVVAIYTAKEFATDHIEYIMKELFMNLRMFM
ncbi:zinc ribbon domain-containing protein [Lutibacter sp. B2]|nr:zinc ribbon domain-containing protein [Lutibacter sp. B2]